VNQFVVLLTRMPASLPHTMLCLSFSVPFSPFLSFFLYISIYLCLSISVYIYLYYVFLCVC
jgi:hypothetical protein